MKTKFILIVLLIIHCLFSYGQKHIEEKTFDELLTYISDTTEFWKEIEKEIIFPKKCQEIYASEKIEVYLFKQDNEELKLIADYQNPLFGNEVKKIEHIFNKFLSKNCDAFFMKFYVHFDLEPWYYPNYNDEKTNGGHLYSHNIIVVKEYIIPFIMKGG